MITRIGALLVAFLATARLTRLITTDWLGEWTIVRPIKTWAAREEAAELDAATRALQLRAPGAGVVVPPYDPSDPLSIPAKLAKGLDCPFCVGFWLGLLVLIGNATIGRVPVLGSLWRLALGALALNYVVGHVSSRIDG